MRIVNFLCRLATIYGTALVLMFFSEYFFLNEGPVKDVMKITSGLDLGGILAFIEFSLFYALFSVWLLFPIYYFRIRSIWALYLAGGFFGIATEGLVIPLIYTESLTWPALSWHVLADVILGWYVVRRLLTKNRPPYTILLASGMGLFWAFWAPWTHIGEEPFIPAPSQFMGFVLFTSAGLVAGYVILTTVRDRPFKPTRTELGLFGGLTLALWLPMLFSSWLPMLPVKPVNSLLLPLFLGVSCYTLHRYGKVETRENILSVFRPKIAWWNLLLLACMPITAIIAYPFFYRNDIFPPTALIVYLMDSAAYVLTVLSVFMLWRGIRKAAREESR